jgi:hypothetical protein
VDLGIGRERDRHRDLLTGHWTIGAALEFFGPSSARQLSPNNMSSSPSSPTLSNGVDHEGLEATKACEPQLSPPESPSPSPSPSPTPSLTSSASTSSGAGAPRRPDWPVKRESSVKKIKENNVVLVRRLKRKNEGPLKQFTRWFVDNQIGTFNSWPYYVTLFRNSSLVSTPEGPIGRHMYLRSLQLALELARTHWSNSSLTRT